jgi:nucleoside-diphosphate-sugar epimerase
MSDARLRDAFDAPSTPGKKALVTGATGFTGGALTLEMQRRGYQVRALVRSPGKADHLRQAGIELVEGDITDPDAVMRAAEGVELIQHIAALFRTAGHPDSYYHDVNHHAVNHIIAAAKKHNVARTVHCSTVGVHGNVKQIPSVETSPYNPGDIYQVTKLEGEKRMQEAIADGFSGTIFRPAGIYGPGDLRFLKVFRGIQRGKFPMFGNGRTTYHFTYIDDLVDGIIRCGEHPDALRDLFILGGDEYFTLDYFMLLVAAATGGTPPRFHLPITPLLGAAWLCENLCKPFGIDPPLHVRRCEFFIKSRAFSSEKARRLIGFTPRVNAAEGIYRTAQWYAKQSLIGVVPDRATYEKALKAIDHSPLKKVA